MSYEFIGIRKEDRDIVSIQEQVYDNILSYAASKGLITEEERKDGVTLSKLVLLIIRTPKCCIGLRNLKMIKSEEKFRLYMPDEVFEALRKR